MGCGPFKRLVRWSSCHGSALVLAVLAVIMAGCGGGGSAPPNPTTTTTTAPGGSSSDSAAADQGNAAAVPANVLTITVDRGLDDHAVNVPFVDVTICQPGTQICKTIDHVLVDTGSNGLRLHASAVAGLSLPAVAAASGAAVGQCAQFASGRAWGSVRRADVRLAGERAGNIPIQIVADPALAAVPQACRNTGPDIGVGLSANGILGVGMQAQDCGPACAASAAPGLYYSCSAGACSGTALPLASQVLNPVASFATNNNGVAVVLPAVPPGGVPRLAGSLIFGIDTQANNRIAGETVFQADSRGLFITNYKGVSYPSFIDSGSNGIFFPDATIPQCFSFYCPPEPLLLSAVNTSVTGVSGAIQFRVEQLVTDVAAIHLGGSLGAIQGFDWGLPFFFGRRVFVAMTGAPTSRGPGPYWAY